MWCYYVSLGLSFTTCVYHSSLPAGPLGYILSPHRAAVDNFSLILHIFLVRVEWSKGESYLWFFPRFPSRVQHILFVTYIVLEMGVIGRTDFALWDSFSRICSIQLAAFLCNYCQPFSSVRFVNVHVVHPYNCIYTTVTLKKYILFYRTGLTSIWPIAKW